MAKKKVAPSGDEEINEALQEAQAKQTELLNKIQTGSNAHGTSRAIDVLASYEASIGNCETDEQKAHLLEVLTSNNHKNSGKI